MKADAIRELNAVEIDTVAGGGGKWVKMLTKWYWCTGDGKPKEGAGPGSEPPK